MSAQQQTSHLTSGRLLARNTIWNLFGQILPMAAGVVAIPLLIRGIGVERFGLLSLAWIVIGYFSLFDLGTGRALTKLVADKLGAHQEQSIPPLVWTSLLLMFLSGVIGGVVTWAVSPWLVERVLQVPAALQTETLRGFYLLGTAIPMVTTSAGLRGVLEALQRFRVANVIRIPMSTFSFAGPLLVLPFSHSLVPVISILVVGRLAGCVAHLLACIHVMPPFRHGFVLQFSAAVPLLQFGGWMTVSNLVSPIMVYLDRLFIGALLSVSAVAYYAAPFDMVTRLSIIPAAVAGVLFPAFATSLIQDPNRTGLLLRCGVKYVFLALFPLVLLVVTFAPEVLRLWLGADFAQESGTVLRWLAAGVYVNCLAQIPFALIQSAGRPDITAKLHLVELPAYLLAIWVLTKRYGIEGTAIAWTGRVGVDALLLFLLSSRVLPKFASNLRVACSLASAALVTFGIPVALSGRGTRVVFLCLALAAFGLLARRQILDPIGRLWA